MKHSSKRTLLGACALGLTLLSGCVLTPGEPNDPPPVDPPPVDPPPVDPPPVDPPPVDPPPPGMSVNGHADEYDPLHHRVLIADCENSALLTLDPDTGERSVLIDEWGFPEPDGTVCVEEIMVRHDGVIAYAVVRRTFDEPGNTGERCVSLDYITFNTLFGIVTPYRNIEHSCGEGDGGSDGDYSRQIDEVNGRLLYLRDDCNADWCDYSISATPFNGEPRQRVTEMYPLPCFPDEEGCVIESFISPIALVFDPVEPDHRVLVFAHDSATPFEPFVEVRDLTTGEVLESFPIQSTWGDLSAGNVMDVSVDLAGGRVLVTMAGGTPTGDQRWPVIAIDRHTGQQTLIHDGSAPAGAVFTSGCRLDAALDTQSGRLILVEQSGGFFDCPGNDFALDLATGELSLL